MNVNQAIERLRQVIRRQHKAISTESSYVHWLRQYMTAIRDMPDSLTSREKVERFLTHLACDRNVSASTQNQAFNAIIFFYTEVLDQPIEKVDALRAKRPAHMRHAPTIGETTALLQAVRNESGYPTNLITRMLYGCGLRVCEPLNLRIKDVNLERLRLCIIGAKGGKDRVVVLPSSLIPELKVQMDFARAVWQGDKQDQIPLMLPGQLAKKYPEGNSRGLGRGCFRHCTPARIPAPGSWSATGCMKPMSNAPSS
jgi:integrase